MDEILYELKEHSTYCGRWDYIFSYLKKFHNHEDAILPDRSEVTMTAPFMRSYFLLVIQTCHTRNAHAIGGMAAQIPVKDNLQANSDAFAKIRVDKEREARDGHDGTWVAHPAMVSTAKEAFDRIVPKPNQIYRKREDIKITRENLIEVTQGKITEAGVQILM
jgi:malate synthase